LPAAEWGGNLVFRVRTAEGSVIHKIYRNRHGLVRTWVRCLLVRAARVKTGTDATSRWRTEADVLAVWRAAGFDVPADESPLHPELAGPRRLVLEDVAGHSMLTLLASKEMRRKRDTALLPCAARDELLRRFAEVWCRRHALAMARSEPRLVQEHGGFQHVLVSGQRLVHIDFEQAFLRPGNLRAKIAREMAGYLRSLYKRIDADVFRAYVEALADGYGDREFLSACVNEYLSNPDPRLRAVWAVDRFLRRSGMHGGKKYDALAVLAEVLQSAPQSDGLERSSESRPTG